jgi:L-arabinose transport system permease protein
VSVQSPPPVPTPARFVPRRSAGAHLRGVWEKTGMLLVLLVLLTCFSLFVDNFLSWKSATALAQSVAIVGTISCTMLFCMASGDFDLSVGSTVALSGVASALAANASGSVLVGMAVGVLVGGAVGLFNGFVIAQLGINALITTLASMEIVRGLAYILSNDSSVGVISDSFSILGQSAPLGIKSPVWIMFGCFVLFGILLNRTVFGRNSLAIGGNAEAARLAGVRVARTKIIIFTLQGLVAGFAGVIETSRFTIGDPKAGVGLELDVISACVLGGVSLTGGIGTMLGVVVGVFIMGAVDHAMKLKNIDSNYQYCVRGAILLAAVLIDKLKQWFAA